MVFKNDDILTLVFKDYLSKVLFFGLYVTVSFIGNSKSGNIFKLIGKRFARLHKYLRLYTNVVLAFLISVML
jgi:hypothetical protein